MDYVLQSATLSPNISYSFVGELTCDYENLKSDFGSQTDRPQLNEETVGWRDDMKFLNHLCHVFNYYERHQIFPSIRFHALPQISNARWNSRAIFALLAFILLPQTRTSEFENLWAFIAGPWCRSWFSDQKDWQSAVDVLKPRLQQYPKALQCFERHWVTSDSVIDGIQRNNQCAERAIQIMEEMFSRCKSAEKLNDRFILSNNKCP